MRIAIATDAWFPQVNGVVRSISTTVGILMERGYEVELITPDQFLTVPMPGYSEIRLAIAPRFAARRALKALRSAWMPAPPEGSDPAMANTLGMCDGVVMWVATWYEERMTACASA